MNRGPLVIPAIVGTATLAAMLSGAAVSFAVYWKSVTYMIRHSRYRNHADLSFRHRI
jgi:hypothetical protein